MEASGVFAKQFHDQKSAVIKSALFAKLEGSALFSWVSVKHHFLSEV